MAAGVIGSSLRLRVAGTLVVAQHLLCGFVEVKRWQDFRKPGSQAEKGSFLGFESSLGFSGDNGYPGGIFDPMGEQQREQLLAGKACLYPIASAVFLGV